MIGGILYEFTSGKIKIKGWVPSVSRLSTVSYVITRGYKGNEYEAFRYSS
jgi:hypothetical protein